MHDIRESIPKTDQTLPGKFPQYEFREFPKMVVGEDGKPVLGPNKSPLIANSEEEYNVLHARHYKAPVKVASLAQESEEVTEMRAELEALRVAASSEPKRRGRPPRVEDAA